MSKLLKRVFKDVYNNPILLIPDVLVFLMTLGLGLTAGYFSGLFSIVNGLESTSENIVNRASAYFFSHPDEVAKLIIGLAGFLMTTFLFGASLHLAKYVMFKDVLDGKKPRFIKSLFDGNRKYYWRFIGVKLAVFFIFILGFLISIGISSLFLFFSKTIAGIVFFILFIPLFIYLMLHLFFVFPIFILDGKGVKESIKESFTFFKKNKKFVFRVFFMSLLIYLGFWFLDSLLILPFEGLTTVNVLAGAFLGVIPVLIVGDFPFMPPFFIWQAGYYGFLEYYSKKD